MFLGTDHSVEKGKTQEVLVEVGVGVLAEMCGEPRQPGSRLLRATDLPWSSLIFPTLLSWVSGGLFAWTWVLTHPLVPLQLQQTEAELRKVDEAIALFQKML